MAKCKYPDEICSNMTILHGIAYCNSVPCSLKSELPKQTNADRIRSMSDKELAELIYTIDISDYSRAIYIGDSNPCDSEEDVLEWLESEVK